ncbi:MAG TPA: diphosphomevalonate decarboxylase [Oceanospirillaceae bacterium]|nr:diphosphomevalonate decarboxylase [Oceanospirillaceae bacterium]
MTAITPALWVQEELLAGRSLQPTQEQATAYAPANIALSKYWGKRESQFNLPLTGSLSVSLANHGTHTQLSLIDAADHQVYLNGVEQAGESAFVVQLKAWLSLFLPTGISLRIETRNTIPTAAGLASSASGYGALALACNELCGWQLDYTSLSALARLGSGSASRSLWHGFVKWQAGEAANGHDSVAYVLPERWPQLRVGILTVSDAKKAVSSREGMGRTVQTSALFKQWPAQAASDMQHIEQAIMENDFVALGQRAEHNAMSMHATMQAAWPPLVYWQPESLAAMQQVWELRQQGLEVYFTMDAGPNLKLLFEAANTATILQHFPTLEVIQPFADPS